MRKTYLVISLLLMFQNSFAQSLQETFNKIEAIMSRYYQPKAPGCQLAISSNGEIIYSKAWGMADIERNVPITTNSIIEAGSVSKQLTAAAILLLEQQGKLSLNDDVRKYIPEIPAYENTIKISHLMHHTSGLRDWGSIAHFTGWSRSEKFYTNNDALEIIARQKKLNNKPGDEFIYSNSNYNLLAILVQRVSGLTLADFTRQYIFEPAQMIHTQWRDNPNRVVSNRAIAYAKKNEGLEISMPNEFVYGNGGLLTTAEDLLKWNKFYFTEKMEVASLLSRQTHTEPFNNGFMNDYGAGIFIQRNLGWQNINHGGITGGYTAFLTMYPELNLSVALLSNTSEQNISAVAKEIILLLVSDKSEKKAENSNYISMPEKSLLLHEGWYRNERDGTGMKISVKDKNLMINTIQLNPITENKLAYANNFLLVDSGKRLRYVIPGRDTIHFSRVEPALAKAEDFQICTGKFFSEETNSTVNVRFENGKLSLLLKTDEEFQMAPLYKDGFRLGNFGVLYFTRDKKNKITGLKISDQRARNVEFVKQR